MPRIQLVHRDPEVLKKRKKFLREAGYTLVAGEPDPRKLRANPPHALVIDVSRQPTYGRDLAMFLRTTKRMASVPVVLTDATAANQAKFRKQLPDATFCTWRGIRGALKKALASPPQSPRTTKNAMAGYSGTPLPKKLGIKEASRVLLIAAPKDFETTVGELPPQARLVRSRRGPAQLAIWFVKSRKELTAKVVAMGQLADGLWIAWPKQASGVPTDLNGNIVRETGLAHGLVDYKICAIDATWSGLKFARRAK